MFVETPFRSRRTEEALHVYCTAWFRSLSFCTMHAFGVLIVQFSAESQVENAEDMRFNYRLASACAAEKQRFCEVIPIYLDPYDLLVENMLVYTDYCLYC